jgi:hypothetical protein
MNRLGSRLAGGAVALFFAVALLAGCSRDEAGDSGVAATVNGAAITVAELEARHDLDRLGLPESGNPTVERLRAEYGAVLADLLVARLAGQELSRRHLAVTAAELAAAEAAVRADYSEEAFADMLLEEHIDLVRWREALRDRLTVEKLCQAVLSPSLRVGVSEAADYYKEHIDIFTRPDRTRFLLVRAKEAEPLRAALAAYRKSGSREDLEGKAGLSVQEVSLADRNLPKPWREALRPLKPGEASPVLPDDAGSAFLVLLGRQGESVLDPAKAYAAVEAILSADKLERAFAAWLTEALATATIRVNPMLAGDSRDAPAREQAAADAAPAAGSPRETSPPARPVEAPAETGQPSAVAQSASPTPDRTVAEVREEKAAEPSAPADSSDDSPPAGEQAAALTAAEQPPAAPAPAENRPVAPTPSSEASREPVGGQPAVPAAGESSAGETQAGGEAEASGMTATPPASPESATPAPPPGDVVGSPPAEPAPAAEAKAGEVEFAAIKASWILYVVDEGQEERVYLKPGKPLVIPFSRRLVVRLGTPSEVSYRIAGREVRVEVPKKETKVLEFP